MADTRHHDRMVQAFAQFLATLPEAWTDQDKEFIQEEANLGEYGDALENLIALGLQGSRGFTPDQVRTIQQLAAEMGLKQSDYLDRLNEQAAPNP